MARNRPLYQDDDKGTSYWEDWKLNNGGGQTEQQQPTFWSQGGQTQTGSAMNAWEKYKASKTQQTQQSAMDSVSGDDYLMKLLKGYETTVNGIYGGHNTRYGEDYDKVYHTDTADWLELVTQGNEDAARQQQDITNYVFNKYGKDSDIYNMIVGAFDTHSGNLAKLLEGATQDNDYWTQFADEDDWNYFRETGRTHGIEQQILDETGLPTWDDFVLAQADSQAYAAGKPEYFTERAAGYDAQIEDIDSQISALIQQLQEAQVNLDTDTMNQIDAQIEELKTERGRLTDEQGQFSQTADYFTYINSDEYKAEQETRAQKQAELDAKFGGNLEAAQAELDAVKSAYEDRQNIHVPSGAYAITRGWGESREDFEARKAARQEQAYSQAYNDSDAFFAERGIAFDGDNKHFSDEYEQYVKELTEYVGSLKYGSITQNEDFEEMSKPKNTGSAWLPDEFYYVNNPGKATEDNSLVKNVDYMSDEQRAIFNYLYNTEGKSSAIDYLHYIDRDLNAAMAQGYRADAQQFAEEHPWAASFSSIPMNLVSGGGYVASMLQHLDSKRSGEYDPFDVNELWNMPAAYSSAIRGEVSSQWSRTFANTSITDENGVINIDVDKYPQLAGLAKIFNGKSLGDVYQLGMSIFDSAASAAFGNAGAVLLGGAAATQTMLDTIAQGGTEDQAITRGFFAGLWETGTEYVSLDHLINGETGKFVRDLLVQSGIEASEEAVSTILNTVSDAFIMKGDSDWSQYVQSHLDEGDDRATAILKAALVDVGIDVVWDALGGFVSGGIHTAGMHGAQYVTNSNYRAAVDYNRYATETNVFDMQQIEQAIHEQMLQAGAEDTQHTKDVAAAAARKFIRENGMETSNTDSDHRITLDDELISSDTTVSNILNQLDRAVKGEQSADNMWAAYTGVKNAGGTNLHATNEHPDLRQSFSFKDRTGRTAHGHITELVSDDNGGLRAVISKETAEGVRMAGSDAYTSVDVKSLPKAQQEIISSMSSVVDASGTITKLDNGAIAEAYNNYANAASNYAQTHDGEQLSVSKYMQSFGTIANVGFKGSTNFESVKAAAPTIVNTLGENVAQAAFNAGNKSAERALKKITAAAEKAKGNGAMTIAAKDDGIFKNSKYTDAGLTQVTEEDIAGRDDLETVALLAKATNSDIRLIKFEETGNGDFSKDSFNGLHNADGVIYLDINAGARNSNDTLGRAVMLTLAHEMTHDIQMHSAEDYSALKEFVKGTIGNDWNRLVDEALEAEPELDRTGAEDEVVANACEMVLLNSNLAEKLARENAGLFEKICFAVEDFINGMQQDFLPALQNRQKASIYMNGVIGDLQKIWDRGLINTAKARREGKTGSRAESNVENRSVSEGVTETVNSEGQTVAATDDAGHSQLSLRTYDEGGREQLKAFLDARVKKGAIDKAEAAEMLQQMEDIYKVCRDYANEFTLFGEWSRAEVVTDPETGNAVFSVVKANGDYAMNLDFSLVCKKRRTLDAVFNQMIQDGIMDDFEMREGSIAKINEIIREHDFETACALCFVDSKRYRQALVADSFVRMYNPLVRSMVKSGQHVDFFNYGGDKRFTDSGTGIDTLADSELDFTKINEVMRRCEATGKTGTVEYKIAKNLKENPQDRRCVLRGDFMSTAGFDNIKQNNQRVLSLYNSKKGAGGPKAAQSDVQYLSEILHNTKFKREAAYAVGGVRIQSFSDYVPRLVFDYVQMIQDLAAKELPAHAYTKEPLFVMQFGQTGIKTNMSLVPDVVEKGIAPGLDEYGNYAWKDGQSFGSTQYGGSKAFVELCYNLIGKEYTGQDRLSAAEGYELAKVIQNTPGYSNNCGTIAVGVSKAHITKLLADPNIRMVIPYHKSSLNHLVAQMNGIDKYKDFTTDQNTRYKSTGKKLNKGDDTFNYNEALLRTGDAKAAADEYLAWCRENDYIPKFDDWSGDPNYYKMLEDFAAYDNGVAVPQGDVKLVLPGEGGAFGSFSDLIRMGLEEDAILQGKQDAAIPEIVNAIKAELPGYEASAKANGKKKKAAEEAAAAAQYQRRVTEPEVLDYLNEQIDEDKYETTYKAFSLIEGALYPPMASYERGEDGKFIYEDYVDAKGKVKQRKKLRGRDSAIQVSELRDKDNLPWIMSEGNLNQNLIDTKPHKKYDAKKYSENIPWEFYLGDFSLDKSSGKGVPAAYNPYQHSSNGVLNDQFEEAYNRPEIVVVECRIPKSEIEGQYSTDKNNYKQRYWAQYAKNPTGKHEWKSGPIAGQMQNFARSVYMTRYIQPVRILSDAEVAQKIADIYKGEDTNTLRMYWNTIHPGVLQELDKLGVDIDPYGSPLYLTTGTTDRYGNAIPQEVYDLRAAEKAYKDATKAKKESAYRELVRATAALDAVEEKTGLQSKRKYDTSGVQFQLRNANAEEVFAEAEQHFGTTENFKDAGWIIPNGNMLDFGERARDHGMGPTSMAHWDVLEILKKHGSGFFEATEDFMNLGAIRMSDKGAFIQLPLNVTPTQAQLNTIAKFADAHNGNIRVNYGSEKTETYKYADAKNIINDIEQQYAGKKQYESPLKEFRGAQFSFRSSTTGMANDMLLPYDAELRKFIEDKGDVVIDSFDKLVQFVNDVYSNRGKQYTAYFGILRADEIAKITSEVENLPGDVKAKGLYKPGRNISIAVSADSVLHMSEDKPLTIDEVIDYLDRVSDVIAERDSVAFDVYTDSYGQKHNALLFKKQYADGVLQSFDVVSRKHNSLNMQTLYLNNGTYSRHKKKKPASSLSLNNSETHTPEASGSQTSDLNSTPADTESQAKPGNQKQLRNYSTEGMTEEQIQSADKVFNRLRFESKYQNADHAAMSASRIDSLVKDSIASRPDYAHSYVAWIDPSDYLWATTGSDAERANLEKQTADYGEFDIEKLRDSSNIYLRVDFETGRITGHEGRHRMIYLRDQGVEKVAVELKIEGGADYNTAPIEYIKLKGQQFDEGGYRKGVDLNLFRAVPVSRRYADAVKEYFSENAGTMQFQRRSTERSDAQVLAEAFDDSAVTDSEKKSLASFKAQLQAYEAAELKVSQALRENKLSDNAVTRKALQQARAERNSASKILGGMVTNNADLQRVIKAERAIMAEGTRDLRREFNREYRELNSIIKGLESERREDIATAYNAGVKMGIFREKLNTEDLKKKARERMQALREQRDESVKKVSEYYRDMMKNKRISAEEKHIRNKIQDLIGDMRERLNKPKENRYVPAGLVAPTIELLESINTDYWNADKKIAELEAELAKLDPAAKNYGKKKAEIEAKIERYKLRGASFREKMALIQAEYDKLRSDSDYSAVYDETVANILQNLPDFVGSTPIHEMNVEQLTAVHNALNAMFKVIKDSVKIKIGTEEVNAYLMARELIIESKNAGTSRSNFFTKYWWDTQRPQVVFERFGGFQKDSYWSKMYQILNEGQLKTTQLTMDLSRPFAELLQDEKALQRFTGRTAMNKTDENLLYDIGLIDEKGESILIPMDMVVSIYLDTLNEDNGKHMAFGGKVIPALDEYYKQKGSGGFGVGVRRAMGYFLDEDGKKVIIGQQIGELEGQRRNLQAALALEIETDKRESIEEQIDEIDDEIKAIRGQAAGYVAEIMQNASRVISGDEYAQSWVKATQQLFDKDSKKALDAVTMDIYGFKKATVEHYYPIRTDKNFRNASFDAVTRDMSLENVGFMKERIHGANPTLALGVSDMVNSQIAQTARYCGLMPAIRQFEKAYGKTMPNYESSVQSALNESMDGYGNEYVNKLMADLTGSRTGEPGLVGALLGALRGNLAQTTLTLSPRTALAQAASIPTAAAILGKEAIAYCCNPAVKVDTNEIAEHSPLWWYRMQGYSSVELGDIKNSNSPTARLWKKMRWATGWIQAMDGLATSRLWAAAKYYVEHTEGLTESDGEYWNRVAEMFNKTIEETQPNYTTMQRPELLRNTNQLQRTLSMFMTQRLQNLSIMTDAVNRYVKYAKDFKAGANNVTEEDVAEARHKMIGAGTSQLAAAATIVAFKTIVNMLMSAMKPYRDDDDGDIDAKSFNLALLDMGVDTIVGNFWLGSNLYSFIKAAAGHGSYYDFLSVNGVETFNSLAEDFVKLANALEADEIDPEKAGKQLENLAMDLATCMGIPVPNALKIAQAFVYGTKDIMNGDFGTWEASYNRTAAQWKNKLMGGYISGDEEAVSEAIEALGGENKAASAVKAYVKADVVSRKPTLDNETALQYLVDWAGMKPADAEDAINYWKLVSANKDYSDLISQARYGSYVRYVGDTGVTVDEYIKYLDEADTNGKNGVSQDEFGTYLRQLVRDGVINSSVADALWRSQWHEENNTSYEEWLRKNR